ncbi:MAG: DNA topoisomerase 3 [Parachlamydiaceae bacterium]
MIVVLTEKPSVARDIAAFLGAKRRHEGYYEGNGYQVTWAFGHLISLKDPEDYDPLLKKWSLATLPFIPLEFELKIVDDKGGRQQFSVIKKLFKSSSYIICATDAGREGELIFRYILTMSQSTQKPWKRLWLSSLTQEALTVAFQNLRPAEEFDNLYAAAKCRSESDWVVGINGTRGFTVRYGGGKTLWSLGRVQTPVLAMIVKRDDDIRDFKSEPFWELLTLYREVNFKLKADRFKTNKEVVDLLDAIKGHPFFITKVTKKNENEYPPLLFDLTELQREMNRKHGFTAADTLQMAQNLYEQKLITYPRTDSRYLSQDMKGEVVRIITHLKKVKSKEIDPLNLLQLSFSHRLINDKKVTDHHAIIPTGTIPPLLSTQSQCLYDAIVLRLIAAFYPPCLKEVTTIEGRVDQKLFQARGVRTVSLGWTALYPKKTAEEGLDLPLFQEGESGPHAPFITEGQTNPPAHYTENALLGAMETAGKLVEDENLKEVLKERGIGTPATRASIIETLIKRQYIQRSSKNLITTDLGRYLIALIQNSHLKSPELTGEWEAKLKQIEKGKFLAQDFMKEIAQFTHQLIDQSDLNQVDETIYGHCPICHHQMIKGKRGVGCSKWKEGCRFVLWKTYKNTELSDRQIRLLLQKGIVLQPIEGHILTLSAGGILTEIPPLPLGGNRSRKVS